MIKASCQVRTKWHNNSNSGNRQLHEPIPWSLVTHQSTRTILHSSLTDPLGPVTVSLSATLTDWVGVGDCHTATIFRTFRKRRAQEREFLTAHGTIYALGKLILPWWWLMSRWWNAKGSCRTLYTPTHTAPTKDSCVKLMENRIVWAVDLWLYIQPHKARSGVKCDSVVEKKTELMYISKLLISQCQIFPSADHQRRAMSCDRDFPAEMWMAVSFWQHSCWSLA